MPLVAKVSSCLLGFPLGLEVKKIVNAGDAASILESGRCPGGKNGNPHQYPCQENPMDRGDWWATVLKLTKS